jgi:hypothetical protein
MFVHGQQTSLRDILVHERGTDCGGGVNLQDDKSNAVCSPQPFIVIRNCTGMECERRKQRAIVESLKVCLGSVRSEERCDVGWKRVIVE